MKELATIQEKLNAPKGQFNQFGKYRYRSCEDILAAVKPLLAETKCTLTITDDVVPCGNRIYIKATTILKNEAGECETTTAFAREEESKKGMDSSQVTGAASSYARKYALNGLFAIDDTKDSDATNTQGKDDKGVDLKSITETAVKEVYAVKSREEYQKVWAKYSQSYPQICQQGGEFYEACVQMAQAFPQ
ncbi:MAG: ERF family protein [Bacteroidales bacterium]|nr:ERF family protein [Bacteroidales bacterium]